MLKCGERVICEGVMSEIEVGWEKTATWMLPAWASSGCPASKAGIKASESLKSQASNLTCQHQSCWTLAWGACRSLASVEKMPPVAVSRSNLPTLGIFFRPIFPRQDNKKTSQEDLADIFSPILLENDYVTGWKALCCIAADIRQTLHRPCTTLQSSNLQSLGCRSAGLLCRNALASKFEDQGDLFSRLHLLFLYITQIHGAVAFN